MNWIGAAIGGVLGFARGRYLGGIFGASLGYWIEMQLRSHAKRRPAAAPPPGPAGDPYATLGVSRDVTDEELRTAYREKAKHLHPDALRARGLSDELMKLASEEMARVNAAWTEIKKERGI